MADQPLEEQTLPPDATSETDGGPDNLDWFDDFHDDEDDDWDDDDEDEDEDDWDEDDEDDEDDWDEDDEAPTGGLTPAEVPAGDVLVDEGSSADDLSEESADETEPAVHEEQPASDSAEQGPAAAIAGTSADATESESDAPLPDSEPIRIATDVVPQLRRYARGLNMRSAALGAALDDYAGRVESAARGELPAGAAQPPESLSPDLVARELTPSRLAGGLELLRNVLIFMPVLWTWFEIGRATEAYSALLARGDGTAPEGRSFLHLWQQGFDGAGGAWTLTLSETAWIAAGLILLLVVVHLGATVARSANVQRRERRAADFAALLSRASALRRPEVPETPQQQLEEFARAGLSLSTQLADLSVSFGQRTAPLAESLAAAERAMAGMSDLVRRQSEQMAEVTKSLSEVAAISRRLEAVEASMTRSSEALEGMQNRLVPATEDLVEAIRGFSHTAASVARATDNFSASLVESGDQAEALREAAASLNTVGNRFLDNLGRP